MEIPAPFVSLSPVVTPPSPRQLHYAPLAPWNHRRRVRRALFAAAGAIIILSSFIWGAAVRQRMRMLYLQHQCMSHTAAPTQIVFTNDPVEAAKLSSASDCQAASWAGSLRGTARHVSEWDAYCPPAAKPTRICGTVFCHALRSPCGNERLVTVDLIPITIYSPGAPEFYVESSPTVLKPASLLTSPVVRVAEAWEADLIVELGTGTTTFYAGQRDPADTSHFTFVYRHRDHDTLVDGWLNDDDTVSLQRRLPGSPLARPPMPVAANPTSRDVVR